MKYMKLRKQRVKNKPQQQDGENSIYLQEKKNKNDQKGRRNYQYDDGRI